MRWTALVTMSELREPEHHRRRTAERDRQTAERDLKVARRNLKRDGWPRSHPLIPEILDVLDIDGTKTPVKKVLEYLRTRDGKPGSAVVFVRIDDKRLCVRYRYPTGMVDDMSYAAFKNLLSRIRRVR